MVLLEIREVGLRHMGAGREVGLCESAGLARADRLAECRGTPSRDLANAFLRKQMPALGDDLGLIVFDQLAQATGFGGFIGTKLRGFVTRRILLDGMITPRYSSMS